MSAKWTDILDGDQKKLLLKEQAQEVVTNADDWFEVGSIAYGMLWFLAMQLSGNDRDAAREWLFEAEESYKRGHALSPGINGVLNPSYVDKGNEDYSGQ